MGPASQDPEVLEKMVRAGMNVARMNLSHGDHATHKQTLDTVRKAAERAGVHVGVLLDLSGPKIRVGKLPDDGIALVDNSVISLACGEAIGTPDTIPVEYEALVHDVSPGEPLLFDDGTIEARVERVDGNIVTATVVQGGLLKSRKGLNLPGTRLSIPSVTQKDWDDLEWGLANHVDMVALSFVRRAEDLDAVSKRLSQEVEPPLLVAKIETPQAVDDIDRILARVDGIMVARGDLAVEMDFDRVPVVQKRLVRRANEKDVPVIVATQMLESMTTNPRPTRAEASDVANAILDGADAVMLSGETAVGKFPVQTIEAMAKIAMQAEQRLLDSDDDPRHPREAAPTCLHDALALGLERIAREIAVKAIVVATLGGDTARYVAASRPRVPILVISSNLRALGRSMLYRGVVPMVCPPFEQPGDALKHAENAIVRSGLAETGEMFILAVGRGPSKEFSARIHIKRVGEKVSE